MPSIFDKLSSDTSGLFAAKPADQGQQATNIAAVGASGKVQPGSAPRGSSLGEQAAVADIKANLGQIAQQKQQEVTKQAFASQQLDREASIQNKQLDQSFMDARQTFANQTNALLGEYERGQKAITNAKDMSSLEQLGINLRLSSDKYIFDLQQEGDRSRLDNQLAFDEELQRAIYADNVDLAKAGAEFNKLYAMNDAEFNKLLASIDINNAAMIFASQRASAERASTITAVGEGVSKYGPTAYDYATRSSSTSSTSQGPVTQGPVAGDSEGVSSAPTLSPMTSYGTTESPASYNLEE